MGLSSSSDIFNQMTDTALEEVDHRWFSKVMDDIVIYASKLGLRPLPPGSHFVLQTFF